MNKQTYLNELRNALWHLPPHEIEDVLRDQNEYINDAVAAGRTEEQVIASLGDVKSFASSLQAQQHVQTKIQNAQEAQGLKKQMSMTFGAVLAILALAPLNILIILGPFVILCFGVLFGWIMAFVGGISGLAAFAAFVFKFIFVSVGFWTHVSGLFFILGSVGLGVLGFVVMTFVTKIFFKITLSYLKWNINFIKGRA